MLAPLGRIQDIAEPLPGSKEGSFPGSRTINLYFTSLSLQIGKVIPFTFVFLDPLFERFPSYIQILAVLLLPFQCFQNLTYRSNFGAPKVVSSSFSHHFRYSRISSSQIFSEYVPNSDEQQFEKKQGLNV